MALDAELLTEIRSASANEAAAYLLGAAHDATFSGSHRTTRFCQADLPWLEVLAELLLKLGIRSWTYREGRDRSLWVLECSWRAPAWFQEEPRAKRAYARGYFDAEGGIPRSPKARFYVQFVQKDREDLERVREILVDNAIACGRVHNPSARVDPDYWRFYVAAASHERFKQNIGSWHPRKRARLEVPTGLESLSIR